MNKNNKINNEINNKINNKLNLEYPNLKKYGLKEFWYNQSIKYKNFYLGRIIQQQKNSYEVITEQGKVTATLAGKIFYNTKDLSKLPTVGDWVMLDIYKNYNNAVINIVLERSSVFTRKSPSKNQNLQVIASNIDIVFICTSLNEDFNIRRIERYLTIAWDSGAIPVIILTKSDLCDNLQSYLDELYSVCIGVDIIICSTVTGDGYNEIKEKIEYGKTVAFIGSSGVGKSSLINWLMGKNILKTGNIREDDAKGRHTTTHRELFLLSKGGLVIDTPGMRELQIYVGDISKTFQDIEELARLCKFSNCTHQNEPGCQVRIAIEKGDISEKRFLSYKKLEREISYEGLNHRQLEQEKIKKMFGSKKEMKQMIKNIRKK